jgi:hypothetical protein
MVFETSGVMVTPLGVGATSGVDAAAGLIFALLYCGSIDG